MSHRKQSKYESLYDWTLIIISILLSSAAKHNVVELKSELKRSIIAPSELECTTVMKMVLKMTMMTSGKDPNYRYCDSLLMSHTKIWICVKYPNGS